MSNLVQRIITAVLGATIVIGTIVFSEWTFALIILGIMILTLNEFYTLSHKNGYHPFRPWGLLFSVGLLVLVFLSQKGEIPDQWLWALPPLGMACFILPLYSKPEVHPINCLAISLLGVVYIALPFTLLIFIAYNGGAYDFDIILGLILAQWASDSGAYIVGKSIGKTKLFERVSPNKTWEGTIGGIIFALGMVYGWGQFFDSLDLMQWLGLGLIVAVFGSLGDLTESLFKRTLSVKDSGTVLKGHGGFLDRFDGLIMAIPFALAYLKFIV